jgi:hypothetical protein
MSNGYLECSHCGYEAIEFPESGLLYQDEGEKCMTCGWPGHVDIDGNKDGDEGAATASWTCSDPEDFNGYCTQEDCADCRVAEAKQLRCEIVEHASLFGADTMSKIGCKHGHLPPCTQCYEEERNDRMDAIIAELCASLALALEDKRELVEALSWAKTELYEATKGSAEIMNGYSTCAKLLARLAAKENK